METVVEQAVRSDEREFSGMIQYQCIRHDCYDAPCM